MARIQWKSTVLMYQNTALVKTWKNGAFKSHTKKGALKSHTEAFSLQRLHKITCLWALQLVPLMSMHLPSWIKLYSMGLNRLQPADTVSQYLLSIQMVKGFPVHIFRWPSPISTYFIQPQFVVNEVFYSHTSLKKTLIYNWRCKKGLLYYLVAHKWFPRRSEGGLFSVDQV